MSNRNIRNVLLKYASKDSVDPESYAKELPYFVHNEKGKSKDMGKNLFRTKQKPPTEVLERFMLAPNDWWYLSNVEDASVLEHPGNKFILYDDSKDRGVEVPGLQAIKIPDKID